MRQEHKEHSSGAPVASIRNIFSYMYLRRRSSADYAFSTEEDLLPQHFSRQLGSQGVRLSCRMVVYCTVGSGDVVQAAPNTCASRAPNNSCGLEGSDSTVPLLAKQRVIQGLKGLARATN